MHWTAEQWTATAAVGTFLVALVASGLTVWQVFSAKRLYREQTRPYVIVDWAFSHVEIFVAVKNIGSTAAKDVKVTCDPPMRGVLDHRDPGTAPMFTDGVPMVAPGREMRYYFGSGLTVFREDADVPLAYKVKVSYTDLKGKKRYNDPEIPLDLNSYSQTQIEKQPLVDVLAKIERTLDRKRMWPSDGGIVGALRRQGR